MDPLWHTMYCYCNSYTHNGTRINSFHENLKPCNYCMKRRIAYSWNVMLMSYKCYKEVVTHHFSSAFYKYELKQEIRNKTLGV